MSVYPKKTNLYTQVLNRTDLFTVPTKPSFLEGRYPIPIHLWYIHLHLVYFYANCMYMYGNIKPYMDAIGIAMPKKHET